MVDLTDISFAALWTVEFWNSKHHGNFRKPQNQKQTKQKYYIYIYCILCLKNAEKYVFTKTNTELITVFHAPQWQKLLTKHNTARPSPKPGLGAQRLATVVDLVRGCNLFSMVVDADIVAPEGFLAQLVLSIDLDARVFGGYLCLANVVFRWWHFTICFLFFCWHPSCFV